MGRVSRLMASEYPYLIQNTSRIHVDITRDLKFVGTNAYWLPYLNSEDDISNTLANMSKAGITVVRTWAFNGANDTSLILFFSHSWPGVKQMSP